MYVELRTRISLFEESPVLRVILGSSGPLLNIRVMDVLPVPFGPKMKFTFFRFFSVVPGAKHGVPLRSTSAIIAPPWVVD